MSGYGDFFNAAKKAKGRSPKTQSGTKTGPAKRAAEAKPQKKKHISEYSEAELRQLFQMERQSSKSKRRSKQSKTDLKTALSFILVSALMVLSTLYVVFVDNPEEVFDLVEIQLMGQASAADQEKPSADSKGNAEKTSMDSTKDSSGEKSVEEMSVEEKTNHFSKLNERKKQLDMREKELSELERELQKQKEQVEARIEYLEKVRRDIAGVLQERVEMDEQKVNQLVDFYSNMKPAQAAEIISKINEDLAISVLSKMKKKNAAQILNMIEPKKARVLSEKFAGYKIKN